MRYAHACMVLVSLLIATLTVAAQPPPPVGGGRGWALDRGVAAAFATPIRIGPAPILPVLDVVFVRALLSAAGGTTPCIHDANSAA